MIPATYSPMAISVTDLYLRHHEDHDLEFTANEKNGNPLDAHNVHYMRTVNDSKKINDVKITSRRFGSWSTHPTDLDDSEDEDCSSPELAVFQV